MTVRRYSTVAILFHWAIAILIVMNWALGWRMGFLKGLDQFTFFQLHKSFGITILLLSLGRLAWRLFRPPPPDSGMLKPWEKAASLAVHWAFYGFMILMPLSGWAIVSTSKLNFPTLLYKMIPWPHLPLISTLAPAAKQSVNDAAATAHEWLAWGALLLFLLHVGAVAKHHLFDHDPVLKGMLPATRRRRPFAKA
ncbi:hypothetical protein BH09PSE2_BH09PSE2_20120 [soil metagenome]